MTDVTVGLVADPGLPQNIVESLKDDLQQQLENRFGAQTTWQVESSSEKLPLNAEGEIPFLSLARRLKAEKQWDYFIYLTDLPRLTDDTPMLCEIDYATNAALISLPTLGAVAIKSSVQRLILTLIQLMKDEQRPEDPQLSKDMGIGRARFELLAESSEVGYVTAPGVWNRLRLLTGTIRSNRPGRLVPALSSSMAAAAATGAFGIFYASIWRMADALPPVRLLLISALAISALSIWLIVHNDLWNTSTRSTTPGNAAWDNASAVITVLLSVTMMYAVLFTLVFFGAVAVISTEYLQSELQHPVNFTDYIELSWLAASLGTTAGALGSNFDSDEAIREATYSRRQHERRKLADSQED